MEAGCGKGMGVLDQADWATFKRGETWKALGIAVVLFGTIAFLSLIHI